MRRPSGWASGSRSRAKPMPDRKSEHGLAERIDDLARRVGRLSPSRHDPERFFVERSEIEDELRRAARRIDRQRSRNGVLDTGNR